MSPSVRQFVLSFLITFAPAPLVAFGAWAIVVSGAESAAVHAPLVPAWGEPEPARAEPPQQQPDVHKVDDVQMLPEYDYSPEESEPCYGRAREIETAPEPAFKGM